MHRHEVMENQTLLSTKNYIVGLFGNPNCGKSPLFNQLTGLRQKVGNFPGATVDKKIGTFKLDDQQEVTLIDFPGTYSFYPNSQDERIAVQTLIHLEDDNYPDSIIYIADLVYLEKHLLLFTQLYDLGLPLILVLNMADQAEKEGILVNVMDDVDHCNFVAGSVIRQGKLVVSISTSGAAPALSVRTRQRLQEEFGPEYAIFLDWMAAMRPPMAETYPQFGDRRSRWYEMVDSDILQLIKAGEFAQARQRILDIAGENVVKAINNSAIG